MVNAREAARKLSLHLMQCGMMMPIEWVRENGDGSELQEAFSVALDALEFAEKHGHKREDSESGEIFSHYDDECEGAEEKTYKIPITWQMYGVVSVTARTIREAIDYVIGPECPLPEGNYIDESVQIDEEGLRERLVETHGEKIG